MSKVKNECLTSYIYVCNLSNTKEECFNITNMFYIMCVCVCVCVCVLRPPPPTFHPQQMSMCPINANRKRHTSHIIGSWQTQYSPRHDGRLLYINCYISKETIVYWLLYIKGNYCILTVIYQRKLLCIDCYISKKTIVY